MKSINLVKTFLSVRAGYQLFLKPKQQEQILPLFVLTLGWNWSNKLDLRIFKRIIIRKIYFQVKYASFIWWIFWACKFNRPCINMRFIYWTYNKAIILIFFPIIIIFSFKSSIRLCLSIFFFFFFFFFNFCIKIIYRKF